MVTAEDGTNIVPTHDWTDFFASWLRKFIGIKDCMLINMTCLSMRTNALNFSRFCRSVRIIRKLCQHLVKLKLVMFMNSSGALILLLANQITISHKLTVDIF